MKVPFKYSLDDDYDLDERIDIILSSLETTEDFDTDKLVDKIRKQGLWYRIELSCTLDTDTGTITVEDVSV